MNLIARTDNLFSNLWDNSSKKIRVFIFLCCYTCFFAITAFIVFSPFISAKKSLICTGDGRYQHFPALIYIGRYWRSVILNCLKGDFSIPLFDLALGTGEDIISALNYYGFGDPLTLLSIVVPTAYVEYLYNFLIVLRLYLAGLAFCFLCHYYGKQNSFSIIGSLVYTFCGFAIYAGISHPFF